MKKRQAEVMLYYLFMLADGDMSDEELDLFWKFCKQLEVTDDERIEAIDKCKEKLQKENNVLIILTELELDKMVMSGNDDSAIKAEQGRIIWNLVSLGCADKNYSVKERRIVKSLSTKWDISSDVEREFKEIAETMLALMKQREWISNGNFTPEDKQNQEKQIDTYINELFDDVDITIRELTM